MFKAVLESALPYGSSGLAACRGGHDGRVQPWCKIRQAWIFLLCICGPMAEIQHPSATLEMSEGMLLPAL